MAAKLTARWRLAKVFRTRWAAWEEANRFVDGVAQFSANVDFDPRLGGYVVEVFRSQPGARTWIGEQR